MPKSPMDILDEKLTKIRDDISANINHKEELNTQIYELNLNRIELEHSKTEYENAMIILKRNNEIIK